MVPSANTHRDPKVDLLYKFNHLVDIIQDQNTVVFPEFKLESGVVLKEVPVAYKTWGTLNETRDNVMVICHAFTGSADVSDWWGPLLGAGRSFDSSKFFIICCNVLGSPYGTASPLTTNVETGRPYGPDFPITTIRDDVALHRKVLDLLQIRQVAIVIGGSLGGMHVLEWSEFGTDYVRTIIPIATSGRHSAWGISWGEAQRQTIYSDPNYHGGYYTQDHRPDVGLSVARMSALLTYRSRDSFEAKFGRKGMLVSRLDSKQTLKLTSKGGIQSVKYSQGSSSEDSDSDSTPEVPQNGNKGSYIPIGDHSGISIDAARQNDDRSASRIFSAQSYLRYQGEKFTKRFDANCYIALSKKMDTHDIARNRGKSFDECLSDIKQPAMVVGIETDGLFTFSEQTELATYMPNATLSKIESYDGHDGFLLEFEQLNVLIRNFIKNNLPKLYNPIHADVGTLSEHVKLLGSIVSEVEPKLSKW
ncbi:Homoserine O-acetyltransferase [Smittium mucronatum]|uniref:Homoserine O-acetyltransferase n=1 Tax=Smittium mucronatum TaxID=133383 RepID=A0A1R0H9H4_9FUNG|nr:Homoserine O-acetyltransferase [Smittium mucronatum]